MLCQSAEIGFQMGSAIRNHCTRRLKKIEKAAEMSKLIRTL